MKIKLYAICLTLLMTMLTQRMWATTTITYTSDNGEKVSSSTLTDLEKSGDVIHTYQDGVGTITFRDDITEFPDIFYSSNVKTVVIPEGITSIAQMAFDHCRSMTSVSLPQTLTSINYGAFAQCSSLHALTIPPSVTFMNYAALNSCIFEADGFVNYSSCTDPANWGATIIDRITPDGCFIDDNVLIKYTGDYKNVVIPNGVTTLTAWLFYDCTIESITLPESLELIEENTFCYCNLSVIYAGENPPAAADGFINCTMADATVYVPMGCAEAYTKTEPWNRIKNIVEDNYDYNNDGKIDFDDVRMLVDLILRQTKAE